MSVEPFTLKWGILATGGIAKLFTKDLLIPPSTRSASDIHHQVVAAASSSSLSRAQSFLHEVGAPASATAYGSYASLWQDPAVDIIYIATPHSHHYQHARHCLEAGKHVLCEKAFTVNEEQAKVLIGIAREKGLFLMEAVWTRFLPVAREVRERVGRGEIGGVRRVWADLSFGGRVEELFGKEHRMVSMDLAGGALLDLGIYSLTWVFQFLYHIVPEAQRGPPTVASCMTKYPGTGCDEMTSIVLSFPPNGAHGIATTNIRVSHTPHPHHPTGDPIRIQGTLGEISIPFPAYRGHGLFWEADECARCIRDGKLESETMGWEESRVMMGVMDEVRRQGDWELERPFTKSFFRTSSRTYQPKRETGFEQH
ncbi:hypothetical protein BCR34DRAFT_677608 [Clohesyomyces aquaticus]|uniref:D-xylose 1-dehydrogenase (NADP(+), D-xylono-1,5-lactone-forming) n=1 Tax=Clohesyomyces aquaticus TaxID=1231657 RepID=A0A1Y1YA46_9PLEO|nr:hypothetical protein BCR34DRAFT_677608 [Clohesyomyces aquaticus]